MNLGSNPINLAFRFLLELAALISYGYWGWQIGDGWIRYMLALLVPLVGALAWGTLAVPDDPSRSGKAPVPVPGWLRMVLELGIFGLASWGLFESGANTTALIFILLVILHYGLSVDRIRWLINSKIDN